MAQIPAIIFWGMTGFLFVSAILPFSKIPHGAVRSFAFPREQMFVLTVLMGVIALFFLGPLAKVYAGVILGITALIHAGYIVKFTPIWSTQSVDASGAERADKDNHVSILAANVKQSNREFDHLIDLIKTEQPDIATALEVDHEWVDALYDALRQDYPHWIKQPLENSYGMVLMSKLSLSEVQVRNLLVENVPSFKARVKMRSGADWRLYIVHPKTPVPYHDTKGRDSEIALVGIEAS